jgi:nucleotide-binding universal stress UspA family protein
MEEAMKILVGYDGSNFAKKALNLAKDHAKVFDAKVEVVSSILEGINQQIDVITQAEHGLEYARTFFEEDNISCKTHLLIRGLSPGEDLVRFAKENDINEIVLGRRRRSRIGKLLMGSTAQYVLLNAPCPVVTIS